MNRMKNYKPLRDKVEFVKKTVRGIKYQCAIVKDYDGWKHLVVPNSLVQLLGKPDGSHTYHKELRDLESEMGIADVPDIYLKSAKELKQYLANSNPYWYAEDWDGNYTIIKKSELQCQI